MDDYGCFRVKDDLNQVQLAFSFIRQENDIVFRVEGDSLDDSRPPSNITLLHYSHNPYQNDTISIKSHISPSYGLVIYSHLPNQLEFFFKLRISKSFRSFDEFYFHSCHYPRKRE